VDRARSADARARALAGTIGLFLTLFFVFLRFVPIVSIAEVREIVEDERAP